MSKQSDRRMPASGKFQMRVTEDDWRRLSLLAEAWQCSRAEVYRRLVRQITQQALTEDQIDLLMHLAINDDPPPGTITKRVPKDDRGRLRRLQMVLFGALGKGRRE